MVRSKLARASAELVRAVEQHDTPAGEHETRAHQRRLCTNRRDRAQDVEDCLMEHPKRGMDDAGQRQERDRDQQQEECVNVFQPGHTVSFLPRGFPRLYRPSPALASHN